MLLPIQTRLCGIPEVAWSSTSAATPLTSQSPRLEAALGGIFSSPTNMKARISPHPSSTAPCIPSLTFFEVLCRRQAKLRSPHCFITARTVLCYATPSMKWATSNQLHPYKPIIHLLQVSATEESSNGDPRRSTCAFIEYKTKSSKANITYIGNKVARIWHTTSPSITLPDIIAICATIICLIFIAPILLNKLIPPFRSINDHARFKKSTARVCWSELPGCPLANLPTLVQTSTVYILFMYVYVYWYVTSIVSLLFCKQPLSELCLI